MRGGWGASGGVGDGCAFFFLSHSSPRKKKRLDDRLNPHSHKKVQQKKGKNEKGKTETKQRSKEKRGDIKSYG